LVASDQLGGVALNRHRPGAMGGSSSSPGPNIWLLIDFPKVAGKFPGRRQLFFLFSGSIKLKFLLK
jgi:hypothetical protein